MLLKLEVFTNPIIVVALVSVVTGTIKNLTFVPIYSAKCLNSKGTSFYEPIIKSIVSSGLMAIVFLLIGKLFVINSWIKLMFVAVICAVIGFGVSFIILFNKTELKRCLNLIKTKLLRR